jgi:hypothetical protein
MNITWNKIKSTVPNLHVAFNEVGQPVGMIDKPIDTRCSKNFWRMYLGTGDNAQFLGHAVNKKEAMNHVWWAVEMSNATVVVVENRTEEQLGKHMQIF